MFYGYTGDLYQGIRLNCEGVFLVCGLPSEEHVMTNSAIDREQLSQDSTHLFIKSQAQGQRPHKMLN